MHEESTARCAREHAIISAVQGRAYRFGVRLVEALLLVVMVGAGVVLVWGLAITADHGDVDNVSGTATTGDFVVITAGPAMVLAAAWFAFRRLWRGGS
jgi:hypothetical protein